jgi:hypothetical protein
MDRDVVVELGPGSGIDANGLSSRSAEENEIDPVDGAADWTAVLQ